MKRLLAVSLVWAQCLNSIPAMASTNDTIGDPPLLAAAFPQNDLSVSPNSHLMQMAANNQLNVEDLGFSSSETKKDEKYQALLNRRTKMLKIHQLLGLATGVSMALALSKASGSGAKGEAGKDTREDHEKYGIATGVLYFTTASFSIFAPEAAEGKTSGRTKIHKWLAFVHFPAMVGTMILGIRDKKKLDRGEDASGLKPAFATTAAVAFYTSLAVMVIPFGGKGDHK
jgi:hypothetical protein